LALGFVVARVVYIGAEVQAGDMVFLDTAGDVPVGGSVCAYEVLQVNSSTFSTVSVVLQYKDTGTPVDPIISFYQPGIIGRQSGQGFTWMTAEDVQILPRRIINAARNFEMTQRLDSALSGKASKSDLDTVQHVITAPEAADKKFTLPTTPVSPNEVICDVIGGVEGVNGSDFIIVNDEFRWDSLGFDGLLSAGDEIRLVYFS
jgi:hypothetical protein